MMLKKLSRSSLTKAIVSLLYIASIAMAAFLLLHNFVFSDAPYRFDDSFEESYAIERIFDNIRAEWRIGDERQLRRWLDGCDYYITNPEGVVLLTSGAPDDEAYYEASQHAIALTSEAHAGVCFVRLRDSKLEQLRTQWNAARNAVQNALFCLGVFVLCAIYLLWMCGRRPEDEEVHLCLIDRMWPEVTAGLLVGVCVSAIAFFSMCYDSIPYNSISEDLCATLCTIATAAAASLGMAFLLSLVRNLKNRTLWSRTLTRRVLLLSLKLLSWCWCQAKRILAWCWKLIASIPALIRRMRNRCRNMITALSQSLSLWKLHVIWGLYTILVIFLALQMPYSEACAILLVLVVIGTYVIFLKHLRGFVAIRRALTAMRGGDLTQTVENCPSGILTVMADDLQSIGTGLQAALNDQLRAERMKSELITNVSHDLKTPLTSLINYAELLTQLSLSPEEATDYAAIILQKSRQMKNLTADLFDIAKVQSGNADIHAERLDSALLVRQTLGEMNDAIDASGLSFVSSIPDAPLYILADGKKMSRVLENLIGNCLKYALSGTRVYLTLVEEGRARLELKNIANYEMTFDDGEITERFVRGDESRTTEGSGLGLAIAKSYVEAMGGVLRVQTDGDLFKVTVLLPLA